MIYRKRTKFVNTRKLKKKKCIGTTKNININKYNMEKECKKNVLKEIVYIVLIFPLITFFSFFIISIIPINKIQIIFKYRNYYIGEKIILKNNLEYYCIDNCTSENRAFKLLKADPLDINNDCIIDEKDKVSFDISKSNKYSISSKENIGFYLENLDINTELKNTTAFRLLTSEEYIKIRDTLNFGYDWDNDNWLANKQIDSWWLETSFVKSVYTVTPRGTYKMLLPNEKSYVRPVIVTYKDNVK